MERLEQRVAALEDRQAIHDLLVHYTYLVDHAQYERIAEEIFTEDASDDHGLGERVGREALHRYFTAMHDGDTDFAVHCLSNVMIAVDGETARAFSYSVMWSWRRSTRHLGRLRPADFVGIGAYEDELRRTPEGWRISNRVARSMGPSPLAAGDLGEAGEVLKRTVDNLRGRADPLPAVAQ